MAVDIATTLTNYSTAMEDTGAALFALIPHYIQVQTYYGFKSLGANDIVFPCIHIEPVKEMWSMPKLGKMRLQCTINLYWYCQESNPEAIVKECLRIATLLKKLFSNNALNDLGSGGTNQFKQYANNSGGYYWLEAVTSDITYSSNYVNSTPDNQAVYMRGGMMKLDLHIGDFVA